MYFNVILMYFNVSPSCVKNYMHDGSCFVWLSLSFLSHVHTTFRQFTLEMHWCVTLRLVWFFSGFFLVILYTGLFSPFIIFALIASEFALSWQIDKYLSEQMHNSGWRITYSSGQINSSTQIRYNSKHLDNFFSLYTAVAILRDTRISVNSPPGHYSKTHHFTTSIWQMVVLFSCPTIKTDMLTPGNYCNNSFQNGFL